MEDIRRQYESGELDPIRDDLERFIAAHRLKILEFRAEEQRKGVPLTDESALRSYLCRCKSINPGQEIRDQLDEIQKEKWIRGVLTGGPPDAEDVAREWARQYSAAWRAHRLNVILYILDQEKDRFLRLLTP